MPPSSIEPDKRASYLRGRLKPVNLLADLDRASEPGRPFVTLIGIKGSWSEREECEANHFPEFERKLMSDPEVESLLQPFREIGFAFEWRGYSDPTGEEHSLAILRNPEAEARLRNLVNGGGDTPAP